MKYFFLLVVSMLIGLDGFCQINKAEYFIDMDPGFGNGTNVTVSSGTDINFGFTKNLSGVAPGIHKLYVRTRNASGNWSQTAAQVFYYEPVQSYAAGSITKAEYFIDADPGFGNGTNIAVTAGTDINFSFNKSMAGLSSGLHQLNVRTRNSAGKWSQTATQLFYYEPVQTYTAGNITKAEYFIDTDPGFGNGTNVTVTAGADISFSFNKSLSALPTGMHALGIRTRNAAGKWSQTQMQYFYYESIQTYTAPNINRIEYFFDNDPGFGNGTNIPFTAGKDVTANFSGSLSSLSTGIHRLFVRSRDANGRWSITHSQYFYYDAVQQYVTPNIVKAEYFVDTDPGFGNGTNIALTAGKDVTLTFNPSLSALANGIHRLYIRTRDANGGWSIAQSQYFYYEPVTSYTAANLVKMEYFVDTDPGFGNGTNIPFTAGKEVTASFNSAISALGEGLHRLVVRAKNADGRWSQSSNQLFYKESGAGYTPGTLTKLEWFWDTDPGFGNGNMVSLPAGQTDVSGFVFNVPLDMSLQGAKHNFYVRVFNDWSHTTVKMVDFTGTTLPVTMLSFTAKAEESRVKTAWQVKAEMDMKAYVVEHSTDGKHFSEIGMQEATGNNHQDQAYQFYHNNPVEGMNYYRLKQVEKSGAQKYSAVVSVLFSSGRDAVVVYPNPASSYFRITASGSIREVMLIDMNGRAVRKYTVSADYSLSGIMSGAYLVRIVTSDNKVSTKSLLVK